MEIYLVLRVSQNRVRSITATLDKDYAKKQAKSLADTLVEVAAQMQPPSDAEQTENEAFLKSMGFTAPGGKPDASLAADYAQSQIQICVVSLGFKRKPAAKWWKSWNALQWDVIILGAQERA